MLRALRRRPMAAVVMPLPTELTTPPVMKMYLAVMYPQSEGACRARPRKMIAGLAGGWKGLRVGLRTRDSGRRTQDSGLRAWRDTRRTTYGYEVRGARYEAPRRTSLREGLLRPSGRRDLI